MTAHYRDQRHVVLLFVLALAVACGFFPFRCREGKLRALPPPAPRPTQKRAGILDTEGNGDFRTPFRSAGHLTAGPLRLRQGGMFNELLREAPFLGDQPPASALRRTARWLCRVKRRFVDQRIPYEWEMPAPQARGLCPMLTTVPISVGLFRRINAVNQCPRLPTGRRLPTSSSTASDSSHRSKWRSVSQDVPVEPIQR